MFRSLCFALTFCAACMAANMSKAQSMDTDAARALYLSAKQNPDALEFRDPYYDTMQVLDDEEHGSNSPDRLIFFNDLLKADGRSEQTDRDILVPWLIRYLWVTPYPNYTQGAARILMDLPLDKALLSALSYDVLTSHPHGAARAAVIEPSERYQPWLEEDAFSALLHTLARSDPHPDVRRNALDWLFRPDFTRAEIIEAMRSDPSADLRALWAKQLTEVDRDAANTEAPLREALFDPRNTAVAPQLMLTYLRSGPVRADAQRLSQAVTYLAQNPDHPLKSNMISQFGWQADAEALPMLIAAAPFDDGAALREFLHQMFQDAGAPLLDRSHALKIMTGSRAEKIDVQAIADFMLDPAHTSATLTPLFDLSLGSRALGRLFPIWPNAMVMQASTQKELVERLLTFYAAPLADGTPRGDSDVQSGLLFELQRPLRIIPSAEDREWLITRLLKHAAEFPDDLTYGVSDLLEQRDTVSDDAFFSYAASTVSGFSTSLGSSFVDRLRPGPWEDPVLQAGDLTLASRLIDLAIAAHPDAPDDAYQSVYDLIYGLPKKADLPADLPDLPAFEAQLRTLQARAEREDGYWAIRNWLGED